MPVRGDPSLTWIDVGFGAADEIVAVNCGQSDSSRECADEHKIKTPEIGREAVVDFTEVFPSEPFALSLDPGIGLLFVGHLVGGVSVFDVCGNAPPELIRVSPTVSATGVHAVIPRAPDGDTSKGIYTVARNISEVSVLRLATPPSVCEPLADRRSVGQDVDDFELVESPGGVLASVFSDGSLGQSGLLRGAASLGDGGTLALLHRNDASTGGSFAFATGVTPAAISFWRDAPDLPREVRNPGLLKSAAAHYSWPNTTRVGGRSCS